MLLTDLATVVGRSGLKVVEQPGWKSRGHGSFQAVDAIVCHHTAGPASGNMPSLGVVTKGRAGLAGPLCNLGLGRDGTVYVVAAGYAWHAGDVLQGWQSNDHAIGIEAEATGTGKWPKVQMDAYAVLCAALCDHYDIPVARVLGHKEVCRPRGRKIDPNFDMSDLRAAVRAIDTTPKPAPEDPMPTPKDFAAAVLAAPVTDANPDGSKRATTLGGVLSNLELNQDQGNARQRTIEKKVDALDAKIDALLKAQGIDPKA